MLPILATVAVTLAVTAGLVYCLPMVIPVKLTLTMGKQAR